MKARYWILIAAILIVPLYLLGKTITIIGMELYWNNAIITSMEVNGNELWMNNEINSRTYDQFIEIFEQNPQIETIVQGDMPGSSDDRIMIKLAYFIREKGLNTKLLPDSQIQSGAVDLFLAGVERIIQVDGEKLPCIGVHSWSDGFFREATDFPRDSPEHELNRKYVEEMLGQDDFYWFTIYAAPADSIYQMNLEEIQKYGLFTRMEPQ